MSQPVANPHNDYRAEDRAEQLIERGYELRRRMIPQREQIDLVRLLGFVAGRRRERLMPKRLAYLTHRWTPWAREAAERAWRDGERIGETVCRHATGAVTEPAPPERPARPRGLYQTHRSKARPARGRRP